MTRYELMDGAAFAADLNGAGVFVRLDERGGKDEPAPWAFRAPPAPAPDGAEVFAEQKPVGTHRAPAVNLDASTQTGPVFALTLPKARGHTTVHVLPLQAEISVGRDVRCDVRIHEKSISARHARVFAVATPGADSVDFAVVDNGSANGTRLNGRKLKKGVRERLVTGDHLDFADVAVAFLDGPGLYEALGGWT